MLTCFIMLLESVGEIVFDITGMELFKQLKNTMNLTFCGWNPWSIPQRTRPVALLCAHLSLNQMSLLKDCWIFSFYSSDTPTSAISIIEAFKLKKHLGGPSQKCPAFPLTITTPSWSWCFPQGGEENANGLVFTLLSPRTDWNSTFGHIFSTSKAVRKRPPWWDIERCGSSGTLGKPKETTGTWTFHLTSSNKIRPKEQAKTNCLSYSWKVMEIKTLIIDSWGSLYSLSLRLWFDVEKNLSISHTNDAFIEEVQVVRSSEQINETNTK